MNPFNKKKKTQEEIQKEEFLSLVKMVRDEIPERYNQIELAEEFINDSIDWLISISNRTDGKSFNYVNLLIVLAIQLDIKFCLLSRTYMLRHAYMDFILKIYEKTGRNIEELLFKRTDDYIIVIDGDKTIGIITDLNNATDLKYHSNFIQDYPLICYDEFLAIEGDYLPDEYEKLQTIYESIDRHNGDIPYIKTPKLLLLGNAVNFSSPILANLDLFNRLENHPINTKHCYDNIALEMRKNEHANDDRNTRAFKSDNDAMTTGQFEINNYQIASKYLKNKIEGEAKDFVIKLSKYYLHVYYDSKTFETLLSVSNRQDDYQFCTELKDKKENVTYLKENFYSDKHYKKYDKGLFLFDNAFTKEFITKNDILSSLKINKCIQLYESDTEEIEINEADKKEKIYNDRYRERTLKAIASKFMEW